MRLTHTTDSLPLKSDHWSHKHLTPSKGGRSFGCNAYCKRRGWAKVWEERRWRGRSNFKLAIARGMMGARDGDLDEDSEGDEEFDWDEFYASEQEDEE
jgi:hypothetical protein